jgi:NlpE C-terminal OB domain
MTLFGTMQILGNDAAFTECLTGLEAPVDKGGDFPRFWRQVRSVGRLSEPVYVELEGRFTWAEDGAPRSMRIERFVTIRANAGC